jgi:hypothetical protein
MVHEGLGHGGACVLTGGKLIYVSTVAADCSSEGSRLVLAGGTLMNGITATVCFLLARMTSSKAARFRFFLWLSMAVNLFTAAGYFLFSGIGGFGDWAEFIRGFEPQWAWRVGMTIFGSVAYMLAGWLILLEMRPLIGSDKDQRLPRAKRLAKIAYFTGGVLSCIAGSLNPEGFVLVALSAAAFTFGGTSGLLWTLNFFRGNRIPLGSFAEPIPIRRSWAWIGAASVLAVVFVAFVGPSVRSH